MQIREFEVGDETRLRAVFMSAVHEIAREDYTPDQIQAWAPASHDAQTWHERMQQIRPFVVESDGSIVAYADLQDSGFIDHFYVSGSHTRRGIGTLLMRHILEVALKKGLNVLTSDVSRTAQPIFAGFGFAVTEQRMPSVRGVVIPNARMLRAM